MTYLQPCEIGSAKILAKVDCVEEEVNEEAGHGEDDDELEKATRQTSASHPKPESVPPQHFPALTEGAKVSRTQFLIFNIEHIGDGIPGLVVMGGDLYSRGHGCVS